ncbi:MAG: CARDB domain-containing protein [Thermoplasmata archaeon]
MKGKADMLLANRTLSALVVVCLMMSAFAGIMFMADSAPTKAQAIGDLVVTDGVYLIEGIDQKVDGNVEVRDGGELIVRDGTLSVISNYDQRHWIRIGSGGTLTVEHGKITTYLDQIDPWPELDLYVENGGQMTATDGSVLQFPGSFQLNGGAHVSLYDTEIMALAPEDVWEYVVGGGITFDSADDGPAITVTNSTLELYDSSITDMPEYPMDGQTAANLTLMGSAVLLAVNSFISVDFGPASSVSDWYTHNVLLLNDHAHAYLYGTLFDEYYDVPANRAPAIVVSGVSSSPATPATQGGGDTTIGQDVASLEAVDGNTYQVDAQQTMEIDTWDVGGLGDALSVSSATIIVTYSVAPGYQGNMAIEWARQGDPYELTSIVPEGSDPVRTTKMYNLPTAALPTVADVRNMNLRFVNNGAAGSGYIDFDRAWILFTVGSDAYIYRWLHATVGDEYGVPIPNAILSATFTGITELEGQAAIYYTPSGVSAFPPSEVLDYLGEDTASYAVTKSDGTALVPYLTDIIKDTGSTTTSLFVGSYSLTGFATIGGSDYSSSEGFSFIPYPAMTKLDQDYSATIELIGVSAVSPDPSRWLVVPLESSNELVIEDMNYYHAGDVIVAPSGTLVLRDAVFELVQSKPYERTIWVDGTASNNGTLLLEDSVMFSSLPMNMIVQGYGILIVKNSELRGISIVAKESAQVIMLENSTMDGELSTSWDSDATIIIRDTVLTHAPVLSGTSEGNFTNTSCPAITVEDEAVANIFRWIHVTVYDGAGYPLPNATVSIRTFVTNEPYNSAVSSYLPGSLGVAKVNALGTIITSSGSRFVGNYRVNVTYSFGGHNYYGDEFAVGVKPYSEPLEKNATYGWVALDGALPDLNVPNSITTVPVNPMKGQSTEVYAVIKNDGVVGAYNVQVDFYDDAEAGSGPPEANEWFAKVVLPWIGPGSQSIAKALWIADDPLDPLSHRIVAVVDLNNSIPEMNESDPPVMQYGSSLVTVKNLPDIEVRAGVAEIRASTDPVIVNVPTEILANIYNVGDKAASVLVNFYDLNDYIGNRTVFVVENGGVATAILPYTFTTTGTHYIWVRANEAHSFEELSYGNNNNTGQIVVSPPPNLVLSGMITVPAGSVSGGNPLNVSAQIENKVDAPFTNPQVILYVNYTDAGTFYSLEYPKIVERTLTFTGGPAGVWFLLTAPIVTETTDLYLTMVVNPGHSPEETDYADNSQSLTIICRDVRPDLTVASADIVVKRGTGEVQSETFGRQLTITVTVHNIGGRNATTSVAIGVRSATYNRTMLYPTYTTNVNASGIKEVSYEWLMNLTDAGQYEIWVWLDSLNSVSEPDETNNFATKAFTVNQLQVDVIITPDKKEHEAGDMMVIVLQVYYKGTSDPVKSLPGIVFRLVDSGGSEVPYSDSNATSTGSDGIANGFLRIPADLDTGTYTIRAVILGETHDGETTVHISAKVSGGLFPLWVWLLIIAIVVGVVAGFTLYTYKYGLGKLVECGECGAFIPAASKRCPKCGVEFEPGTMKCSECGQWIPAESTECPNCGVKFVGEAEEEGDYLERMRSQYDEMVSKYRELARPELGKKFSEKEFEAWWKMQPGYITFEDWLAKEEEKKKEGPVPCPVCGTLNPKEATVCHKCGTVFGAAKPAPPAEKKGPPPPAAPPVEEVPAAEEKPAQAAVPPPGAPPRMVIRRPIERKVMPKKIIKTPLGAEEKTEETKENEEK